MRLTINKIPRDNSIGNLECPFRKDICITSFNCSKCVEHNGYGKNDNGEYWIDCEKINKSIVRRLKLESILK